MKKTTSFHLEEDILNEIEEYKKVFNLSSRNVALERMLLERRNLLNLQKLFLNNNTTITSSVEAINESCYTRNNTINTKVKNDKLDSSIEDIYADMPD